jgi:DNA modification methylase
MESEPLLNTALKENSLLEKRYSKILKVNHDLDRTLVSFQASKSEPGYRWYKFKEGYSSALVKYYADRLKIKPGNLLDPFVGSGTSLFTGAELGFETTGVELLPIGIEITKTRKFILQSDRTKVKKLLMSWIENKPWHTEKGKEEIKFITITKDAFPPETELALGKYLSAVKKVKDKDFQNILKFAILCILEVISYTRKDGQYLRWDYRSKRKSGKTEFNKGKILGFDDAIISKLKEMHSDLENFDALSLTKESGSNKNINIVEGSCLDQLPKLQSNKYNFVITSPPYCNRYDYTRTYALELVLLGTDETKIRELRQTMLSCTVENKEKLNLRERFSKGVYDKVLKSFESQKSLTAILNYLDNLRLQKELNNGGIVRMIRNYFFELSLLIFETSRLMKKGGYFVMVNDNVKYAGIEIPVDLILSDFAKDAGFEVESIDVLPKGKGNSSQQMGKHGRTEIRKCVYVWKKL